jgi:hypothetical protein
MTSSSGIFLPLGGSRVAMEEVARETAKGLVGNTEKMS